MFVTINTTLPIENNLEHNNAKPKKNKARNIEIENTNFDMQESLPDIPEHGFNKERSNEVQPTEITSYTLPNNQIMEQDNLVNTITDSEPNLCNGCQKYFKDSAKKVTRCKECSIRIHLTCLRNGCTNCESL